VRRFDAPITIAPSPLLGEGWDEGKLLKVNANAKVVDPNKQTQNQQPKIKGAYWPPHPNPLPKGRGDF